VNFFLSLLSTGEVDPPSGGVSPLAWVIVLALVGALGAVCTVALKWVGRMYKDLKDCNAAKAEQEEDTLGLLKVLRIQMEQSKGGRIR
jgi:hypothetical protein